jgi:hypothetical protein
MMAVLVKAQAENMVVEIEAMAVVEDLEGVEDLKTIDQNQ